MNLRLNLYDVKINNFLLNIMFVMSGNFSEINYLKILIFY